MSTLRYVDGVVREWNNDEGFGVIDSPETPGGCGAVFPQINMEGYRTLRQGQHVRFTFIEAEQDGCPFQAQSIDPID
ncbi:MAG: cold shock protein [Pseudonocardiales bacterium]|nr:cold shock protein [Pseudonocardiales bacterium]